MATADIGVFGGSGLYRSSTRPRRRDRHARTDRRSAPGAPRHARRPARRASCRGTAPTTTFPPHRINYRANLWAMRELGVTRILAPCASGSLQPDVKPGEFVVCDQLVDRTYGREQTPSSTAPSPTTSRSPTPTAPSCAPWPSRPDATEASPCTTAGTVVVIQGPRFSTRAESTWFASAGWEVINMTQYPEAYLARELGICYVTIALITDYDVGVEGVPPVTHEEVIRVFNENNARLRAHPVRGDPRTARGPGVPACATALTGARFEVRALAYPPRHVLTIPCSCVWSSRSSRPRTRASRRSAIASARRSP